MFRYMQRYLLREAFHGSGLDRRWDVYSSAQASVMMFPESPHRYSL